MRKVYITKDVLTASQERITYIFDEFEHISVSVSGGKDSTVLCWMALQEARRRNRKINIFFIDEEAVYQSTVEQIRYLMTLYPENTQCVWYQFPFHLTNATSLLKTQLVCWEEGKQWMREKESYSVQVMPYNKITIRDKRKGFGFYDVLDNYQRHQEKTAFLVGLRASESLNRFQAVTKNPGYKDILWSTKSFNDNVSFYPLYDWNFNDIWRFIFDNHIKYSRIYDFMWKKGLNTQEIRVSSLIHEKAFKSLVDLPEFEPETFERLCKRIDGISVGNLYGKDFLRAKKLPKNFDNWRSYRDFLLETHPNKKAIFSVRFANQKDNEYVARQQCKQLLLNDYENNLIIKNIDDPRLKTVEKWKNVL